MDVEKFFRPNRYFVGLCVLLIVVWFALQTVSNFNITHAAEQFSDQMFDWNWTELGWRSQTKITSIEVIKKSETDAVIEVTGKQKLTNINDQHAEVQATDCSAILILYKSSGDWTVGRVELK